MDSTLQGPKMSLELLSKEEIIQKYKGLLGIAKKAKQAKDEIAEENRKLKEQIQQHETQKEADKKSLMTMKEMLEAYTENKLQLTIQLAELQKQRKGENEILENMSIENESLKRQMQRLTEDNDSLLRDVENMETQLKQVSVLGKEQKQYIQTLEKEIDQLKENNLRSNELQKQYDELCYELEEFKEKYQFIKDVNTKQRHKFNLLKEKFIEVNKKVIKLKECKRILLETQHEYADSVSQWQNEIIMASKLLCKKLNDLKEENNKLMQKLDNQQFIQNIEASNIVSIEKLNELMLLSEQAKSEYFALLEENKNFRKNLDIRSDKTPSHSIKISEERLDEIWQLSKIVCQEYNALQEENLRLKDTKNNDKMYQNSKNDFEGCCKIALKLKDLQALANKANEDYKKQTLELERMKKDNIQLRSAPFSNYIKEQSADSQKECQLLFEKVQLLEKEKKNVENNFVDLKRKNNELKEKVDELSVYISELKVEISTAQQSSEEYRQIYNQKEIEHRELLDEMREINEAFKVRGDYISRQQEEYQKLKQEFDRKVDQLSEKEHELEIFTKKLAQTKANLDDSESSNAMKEEKIKHLNTELENLKMNASNANDFDTQSEILSTSTISRAEELQRLKDVEDSFEDKYNKLRALAAKLKKKLQDETAIKQNLEKELQELKSHSNEMTTQLTDLKQKISDAEVLQKQLNETQKQIDILKIENQKLKSSRKQANVLNLEIEAAERYLTEVTNKLACRTSELDAAQESIKSKCATIEQLKKEIDLLEASKASEIKHSQELKQQIDHLHNTLRDEMHSKQQAYDKSKILEQDVENLKYELENIKMELSQSTINHQALLQTISNEKEQLSQQLLAANAELAATEQKLKLSENAAKDLRIEFLDYKVKAQAVLRKNQNRDSSKEKELEEDLIGMKATETRLNATIQTLNTKIETLEKHNNVLNDENACLQKRIKELLELVEEMRTQNESLNKEIQMYIQQQHETLKQHSQQIESLDKCHKEQIQSLNATHQRQLDRLHSELSTYTHLPSTVGTSQSAAHTLHSNNQGKIDFFLMEREDAEGSEEATETLATLAALRKISNDSSSAKRSLHDFMPLDELLNTPLNAINSEILISDSQQRPFVSDTTLGTDFLQLELNSTKERLQKQETRVRHLTALLAENEQDLAKLTQMNDMLKEELRRQERSVEREEHMHNSEYVKNVIMKFLTLTNADEKTRLVPVLNTILKLSRSETEILNCVAKGQKVTETTQRSGVWGNFLSWGNNSNNN